MATCVKEAKPIKVASISLWNTFHTESYYFFLNFVISDYWCNSRNKSHVHLLHGRHTVVPIPHEFFSLDWHTTHCIHCSPKREHQLFVARPLFCLKNKLVSTLFAICCRTSFFTFLSLLFYEISSQEKCYSSILSKQTLNIWLILLM